MPDKDFEYLASYTETSDVADTVETVCSVLIVIGSTLLFLLCQLVFHVFRVVVNENENSNTFILNILYKEFATEFQVLSGVLLARV